MKDSIFESECVLKECEMQSLYFFVCIFAETLVDGVSARNRTGEDDKKKERTN